LQKEMGEKIQINYYNFLSKKKHTKKFFFLINKIEKRNKKKFYLLEKQQQLNMHKYAPLGEKKIIITFS
jgi:hypothetical protein